MKIDKLSQNNNILNSKRLQSEHLIGKPNKSIGGPVIGQHNI